MSSLLCACLLGLQLALCAPAVSASPQRAIESLEGCSAKERNSGCVRILKRQKLDGGKQRVKAEIRGGRIIWYVYNGNTGKARRTN